MGKLRTEGDKMKRYFIEGLEISAAEAETIQAENKRIITEAATSGNFAALTDLITVYSIGKGGI